MKKITIHAKKPNTRYVKAAIGDEDEEMDGLLDAVDDVADNVEDIQDTIDDTEEDRVDIAINNNIANHYIAECQFCQNVFISAVEVTQDAVDSVHGVCPICREESDQLLKWVIKDANEV